MSYKEPYTEILRKTFLKYMRITFNLLPKMDRPKILDPGCGSGIPTLELADLTNGDIIAIDIDQELIDILVKKIKERDLTNRINTKKMDFLKNDFLNNYFDLIWEEGVLQVIGFKRSLKECYRILKPGGFLVLCQSLNNLRKIQKLIIKSGFKLFNKFELPENCWWTEYYEPLQMKLEEIKDSKENLTFIKNIKSVEAEIRMVKSNPKEYDCAYFIFQKE
ncbi:MAG: methyltransferase domain-containing protein [Candidatus Thorarchaeota archaeon]